MSFISFKIALSVPSMSLYLTGVTTLSIALVDLGFWTTDGELHGETFVNNPARKVFNVLLHGDLKIAD